jgi:superfamily II DNA or RNA helicase
MSLAEVPGGFVDRQAGLIFLSLRGRERIEAVRAMGPLKMAERDGHALASFAQSDELLARLWPLKLDVRGMSSFSWRYVPEIAEPGLRIMPHQWETAEFMTIHDRAYNTSDTRTGKTLAQVLALDYFRKIGEGGAALIVCPLSVMDGAWRSTIRKVDPSSGVGLLRGTKAQRLAIFNKPHNYYVVNYDGLALLEEALRSAILSGWVTKVVVDELNHFGNPSAARYKMADKLFNNPVRPVRRMWGLTGTPGADSLAVFGMCKMINYAAMPWKSKGAWQAATQSKYGPEAWQWRDCPETPGIIQSVMQPNIRYAREAVLTSLPPVAHFGREAALSKEQRKYYETFKEELIVEFEKTEGRVTATQKSAMLAKLFQICLGAVITDNGVAILDNKPRIGLLKELILGSPRKTVIYCHYVEAINDLVKKLSKDFTAVKVDGSVTGAARDAIFRDFRDRRDPRVLVAHQKTVAYGVELAAADQIINNGPQMSGVATYSQGLDRASSLEQSSARITVIDVWASPEERDYARGLNDRKSHSDVISGLFDGIVRRDNLL